MLFFILFSLNYRCVNYYSLTSPTEPFKAQPNSRDSYYAVLFELFFPTTKTTIVYAERRYIPNFAVISFCNTDSECPSWMEKISTALEAFTLSNSFVTQVPIVIIHVMYTPCCGWQNIFISPVQERH